MNKNLSTRASNCLLQLGIKTKRDALKAYRSGALHPHNPTTRGLGWTTYREIAQWLGQPEPKQEWR